ncbi:hypothetical protein [Streptomyces sp. NPDC087294]|uniref:hypothetical protein n=1 Tax=Streptomyces sp. NPDC087294 TaxID=3365777 RepID=UPI003806EA85
MTNTSASSYHVRAVLSTGGLWKGSCDELPGVGETHRSLSQLEARMRAAIGKHAAVSGAFELAIIHSTGETHFDNDLAKARDLRRRANALVEQARAAAVPLAKKLTGAGVSNRDAGTLLGVSGSLINTMIKDEN